MLKNSFSEQPKQTLGAILAFLSVFRLIFAAQNFPDKYVFSFKQFLMRLQNH